MKKLQLLCIGLLSVSTIYGQDISDALRYSQDNIQGTARFRALSGAFGALGGDMSAVSINPAGSAVFSQSHASFSVGNAELNNDTRYFNGTGSTNDSNFDLTQGGASFVFKNTSNSPWRKFTVGVAYDRTNNFDDSWFAVGTNTNSNNFNNTIGSYFFDYANGLRLDEISAFPNETLDQAYQNIGTDLGFVHQQAFLGYESFILEPEVDADDNTSYLLNVAEGNFNHDYTYRSTGYNGKIAVNLAAQYGDNLYLGVNLNSHFIDYDRSTLLFESNNNVGSIVSDVEFENNLSTRGSGFSFQLGGILKLTNEFRVGLTYDSPTWYTIEEETSQFLGTAGDDGAPFNVNINPQVINIYPSYRLQTPSRFTGSAAYVFGTKGLISFDYSTKNYGATKFRPDRDFTGLNADISDILTTAATYRLGGEYKHKQFSFRGGYRFEESPYVDGATVGDLNGFSLGFGYNFGNTRLDITYDQWKRTDQTPLYNIGLIDAATIDRQNSNITLTLGFNI
ncbi:outer membrane protein transport protein (OMPP1/FadL/TodX) [Jejuia pallidilutea]|uniref:Outer membrane protein transport protein (OMPP1/FadL/TodX) n=1 Tax=Jejuia pallidilutea TaxID=504487 RepID=A0A362X483_9FLAO|nr:outer membrane protein transport protein [Jejuia pallidilutea]PQV46896.1 outer membrane protein transport protein (OMPP1/FadL/TodX) [Jejuia pallidilutea]